MTMHRRVATIRRELAAADRIPYTAHVAPSVVRTAFGDYLQVFRLGGASFESNDDEQLNNWHERLNILWRNVGSQHVSLWTQVVRRRVGISPASEEISSQRRSDCVFASDLYTKYRRRLVNEVLMINEIYLAVLYRPTSGVTTGVVSKALFRAGGDGSQAALADALDACGKLAQMLAASLARYEPDLLGAYRSGHLWCSSLLEYLGLLINGEWQRSPLPSGPLNQALATTRLFFGTEAMEYRSPTGTRVAAVLGIKEYPTPSVVGMYNRLLSAPFAFVLTQSFVFLAKSTGQSLLQRQFNRMANAGDFAVSQAAELKDALDALTSNEFVMGDHHFSLQVLADVANPAVHAAGDGRLKALNDHVALARTLLADTGMLVAREDLALEAAFWAQLPGNFPVRPRKAPITSRNFAAMAPFHNYPTGRPSGNHWGDALSLFVTTARSPYYFSLHASDRNDAEGGSRKDTGHTLICGPTGSGKTVFIGFLVAMLERQGATQVIFDKDRGLEILIRAMGGEYLPLRNGIPTGFNPLQLPRTPANVEFLKAWLRELSGGSLQRPHPSRVRESSDLDQALRGTLALEPEARRLSRLVEFLDPTDPEGLHACLARWCEGCRGDYAWVFDNPRDTVVPRLTGRSVIGFDVTEFLDHALIRSPITLYLFHLVRQLLDGRRLVCWMDEFWRLLADPAFESFAKEGPKTWRKLNGVMCLATQSPSDVLNSPISRTLVEQTPTKVFFPNVDANFQEYTEGFGLTEREFKVIKDQLEPGSRTFLVKQAHQSVVCQLDLTGFDAELAVISGRAGEVRRMHQIMGTTGADPAAWLPRFMAECGR
ncbi:MAG TPA: VirB4 family type IV secretion/conjugal transfer ATPase [Steroidobacteraceae bacterium]|jgi:type IV secretion system protein VirB4|nr:VirB4 family type IV secretion/conjugal transfer ATPase [Steroidobacteraceae bacterium]